MQLDRTYAQINLDNLRHNLCSLRKIAGEGVKIMGIVKADAYGHGALRVASELCGCGAEYLGVACLSEALELRAGGIEAPILILGHTPPCHTEELIKNNITQTVSCLAKAKEYQTEAQKAGGILKVHLKIDTGMSRLGFLCTDKHFDTCVDSIEMLFQEMTNLEPEGIFTHFSVSDEDNEESRAFTKGQFALFLRVISALEERGIKFLLRHCANSGAFASFPETYLDMVRPGILTYGYTEAAKKMGLRPVMSVKSRISTIKIYDEGTSVSYGRIYPMQKKTRVGVLPIGYADGLHRCLSNNYSVMTKDGPADIIGRICMDMCMIDLEKYPMCDVGDTVEIFGENNPIEVMAERAGTIPYELCCSVSKRVPRVYLP